MHRIDATKLTKMQQNKSSSPTTFIFVASAPRSPDRLSASLLSLLTPCVLWIWLDEDSFHYSCCISLAQNKSLILSTVLAQATRIVFILASFLPIEHRQLQLTLLAPRLLECTSSSIQLYSPHAYLDRNRFSPHKLNSSCRMIQ